MFILMQQLQLASMLLRFWMVGLFDVVTYHNFGTVLAHTLPYIGIQFPGKKRDRKGSGESYFFFEAYTSWEFNINADP